MIRMIQDIGEQKKAVELMLTGFEDKFNKVPLSFEQKSFFLFLNEFWLSTQQQKPTQLIGHFDAQSELNGVINVVTANTGRQKSSGQYRQMRKYFGWTASLQMYFILGLLAHTPKKDEVYIDFMVVGKQFQRKGVATALLDEVKQKIMPNKRLTLFVSKKNSKAIDLYVRAGFKVIKREKSLVRKLLFGKSEWLYMEWRKHI